MVSALKNDRDGERRRERCQSPAKSREDNGVYSRIGRPNKSICGVTGNARAESIGSNGGPRATRWMIFSNDVLQDIANTATESTGDGK